MDGNLPCLWCWRKVNTRPLRLCCHCQAWLDEHHRTMPAEPGDVPRVGTKERWLAEGRCEDCGAERGRGARCCDACLDLRMERQRRRRGSKAWEPGARGRPPNGYCGKLARPCRHCCREGGREQFWWLCGRCFGLPAVRAVYEKDRRQHGKAV